MGEPERHAAHGGRGRTPGVVRAEHDWSSTAPSVAIVETIAAVEGVDPVTLASDGGPSLRDSVDPELLDDLLASGREDSVSLTVDVDGYTVCIDGSELVVESPDAEPGRGA